MSSLVTATAPAKSINALHHFESALRFETDCWDVNDAMTTGTADFVLLDVRSPELFAKGHIPGAVNLPHGKIVEGKLRDHPAGTVFVVYCPGSHCNGGHRGVQSNWHGLGDPSN